MICPKCGQNHVGDNSFCLNCGWTSPSRFPAQPKKHAAFIKNITVIAVLVAFVTMAAGLEFALEAAIILCWICAFLKEPTKWRYWFFLKHNVITFLIVPLGIMLLLSIFFIYETLHIWKVKIIYNKTVAHG
jgi:hypothetical protein